MKIFKIEVGKIYRMHFPPSKFRIKITRIEEVANIVRGDYRRVDITIGKLGPLQLDGSFNLRDLLFIAHVRKTEL